MFCEAGKNVPLKLGCGQSPFMVSTVVRPNARKAEPLRAGEFQLGFDVELGIRVAPGRADVPKKVSFL